MPTTTSAQTTAAPTTVAPTSPPTTAPGTTIPPVLPGSGSGCCDNLYWTVELTEIQGPLVWTSYVDYGIYVGELPLSSGDGVLSGPIDGIFVFTFTTGPGLLGSGCVENIEGFFPIEFNTYSSGFGFSPVLPYAVYASVCCGPCTTLPGTTLDCCPELTWTLSQEAVGSGWDALISWLSDQGGSATIIAKEPWMTTPVTFNNLSLEVESESITFTTSTDCFNTPAEIFIVSNSPEGSGDVHGPFFISSITEHCTTNPSTTNPSTTNPSTTTPGTTSSPTTAAPTTTSAPTTSAPTTAAPTTSAPTTAAPTTSAPTTAAPTTAAPTTTAPPTPKKRGPKGVCFANRCRDK